MIHALQSKQMVFEVDPDFKMKWDFFLEDWGYEDSSPGLSLFFMEFAHRVKEKSSAKDINGLKKIFDLIEIFLQEGTQEVQDAAATCFLEGVQNQVSSGKVPPDLFSQLLGPESRAYCKAWDEFTGSKTPGLED